jgi:AcrR family transcriptional regulator
MSSPASTVPESRGSITRGRILDVAMELFYSNGIRGVSADRIIEQVGVTKVTFYRHFRTKSDLAVAYLERQAYLERSMLEGAREGVSAPTALSSIATIIGESACSPGFRGCPFINAGAEFADADDPIRHVVDAHRRWTFDFFAAIARDANVDDADATASQLMMLRDGAMVGGYLSDAERVSETLAQACLRILGAS